MEKSLIMIVDDDKDVADSVTHSIKGTDKYETLTAYSAKEALDLLKKNKVMMGAFPNRIRCIILDIKMPEMDGLEFLDKLRSEYKEKIGVIILSAWEDEEKWRKAALGLVAGYIKKPFDKRILLDYIDDFFEGRGEHMVQLTKFAMEAKEYASKVKKDFDPEKIREKIRKEEEEEKKRKK